MSSGRPLPDTPREPAPKPTFQPPPSPIRRIPLAERQRSGTPDPCERKGAEADATIRKEDAQHVYGAEVCVAPFRVAGPGCDLGRVVEEYGARDKARASERARSRSLLRPP